MRTLEPTTGPIRTLDPKYWLFGCLFLVEGGGMVLPLMGCSGEGGGILRALIAVSAKDALKGGCSSSGHGGPEPNILILDPGS